MCPWRKSQVTYHLHYWSWRFRWLRLPFGLSVSSEIFQKRLHQTIDGISGVICVADDIVVFGCGCDEDTATKDHDVKLVAMLERCWSSGIALNKKKTGSVKRKHYISGAYHITWRTKTWPWENNCNPGYACSYEQGWSSTLIRDSELSV